MKNSRFSQLHEKRLQMSFLEIASLLHVVIRESLYPLWAIIFTKPIIMQNEVAIQAYAGITVCFR